MGYVRTITGDIKPENLGWCQSHEHIFIADGPSRKINNALYMNDYERSCAEVEMYREAGGQSFVDAQPFACGRMAENLVAVSKQTGVNIIACTGFHKIEFFEDLDWVKAQTEEFLAQLYIGEVEDGMITRNKSRLSAKAGIVKCAAIKDWKQENRTYVKLFEAVASASAQTGAPVMIHMDDGADAFSIVRFFGTYDIDPNKLIFCHLDRTKYDFGYHEEVASTGAFLEYDTIHRLKYHSDEQEVQLIVHIAEKGYVDKILLSLDTTNQRLKNYGANFGLDYILTEFRYLLEPHLGKDVIRKMMIENPAKALSFSKEF